MTRPPLVYLDTQQWSYLADGRHTEGLGLDPTAFQRATRAGELRIVASLALIEELITSIDARPDLVARTVPRLMALAGRRVLQPLHVRHQLEVSHGGMLPERQRYLPAAERNGLHEIQADESALRAIAQEAKKRKIEFKESEEALRAIVSTELRDAGVPPTLGKMVDWYQSHDLEEWIRSIVERGQELGLYDSPDGVRWNYRLVPSVYTFVSYRLARIVHTVGEGRRIEQSELDDAHHAAAGPYYDILVTDDRRFREALDLVPDLPFSWMTSADFAAKYLNA